MGPDERPDIHLAFINDDGTVDTTGHYPFTHFATVPQVGDVIAALETDGSHDAVVVVSRYFINPFPDPPRWWIVTRTARDTAEELEMYALDRLVNQAFAEIAEERRHTQTSAFLAGLAERKRVQQEESAAEKASRLQRRHRGHKAPKTPSD